MEKRVAIVFGVGSGLGSALARACARDGMSVAVVARNVSGLTQLAEDCGGSALKCDVAEERDVAAVFAAVFKYLGPPDLVIFNAAERYRGALTELDVGRVSRAVASGAIGGLVVGQAAARAMLPRGRGSIFFTGATASLKGMSGSAPFAMQKFALRGLAQCMARELQPKGLHVAHVVIDGAIASEAQATSDSDRYLNSDAIARQYIELHHQDRSAWTFEIDLRPWTEIF